MKILLTGATGYIGKRLLPQLIEKGHRVVCFVRDKKRFEPKESLLPFIDIVEADLLDEKSLIGIPDDIDAAYYLVHSMSASKDYRELEERSAINFREAMNHTEVRQVIYLSGIVNDRNLSPHLSSRKNVEDELKRGKYALTTLRAGIIIGSGSASFEIIRDLVEKLPVMITPRWLKTRCQPIAISDVLKFLSRSLTNETTYDQSFDIGGPDILTYKQMLLGYAQVRGLKRYILTLPVMTPRLSSYWLYFVTSTSYKLAVSLVDSMKVEVVAEDSRVNDILNIRPVSYRESLERTLARIDQNIIVSSWKDAFVSGRMNFHISDFLEVPTYGCYKDRRWRKMVNRKKCADKLWRIGGNYGWYYANWLWEIRGFLDKLSGGVGLRRGRTDPDQLHVGDAVDFWRVLYANKEEGRLLLFAEMKLPGEAWLEFRMEDDHLFQTATFRPKGLKGRLYWFSVFPFHALIFGGLIKRLADAS